MLVTSLAFALPAGAAAENDNYACLLMPSTKEVKQVFGLSHVLQKKNPGGGTNDKDGSSPRAAST